MNVYAAAVAFAIALIPVVAPAHEGAARHPATSPSSAKEQKPWGIAGDEKAVSRTIVVSMTDGMRLKPDRIAVKQGETVRFEVRNDGTMLHEMVLGTRATLAEHAKLMRDSPGMEHNEPYMVHVAPGKTGTLVWTFNRPGDFEYACLVPGHYEAGMKGRIEVSTK